MFCGVSDPTKHHRKRSTVPGTEGKRSETLLWGATGEQEWTPALTTGEVSWNDFQHPDAYLIRFEVFQTTKHLIDVVRPVVAVALSLAIGLGRFEKLVKLEPLGPYASAFYVLSPKWKQNRILSTSRKSLCVLIPEKVQRFFLLVQYCIKSAWHLTMESMEPAAGIIRIGGQILNIRCSFSCFTNLYSWSFSWTLPNSVW